jgi:hypothetical protein
MGVRLFECACVYGEDVHQVLDSIDNPLTAVFIAFTGKFIYTAEKGTANTA